MNRWRSAVVFLLVCGLRPAPAAAQTAPPVAPASGRITGLVVDQPLAAPLPAALVHLAGSSIRTVAGRDGRFVLDPVPTGTWTIEVSVVGFGLARQDVVVQPGGTTSVVISLVPGGAPYAETVTVRPDPFGRDTPGVAGQFALDGGDLLALRGVLADDPMRAAQAMPGVTAGDDFSATLAVRGQGPAHLEVGLDGIDSPLLLHAVRGVVDTGSLALFSSDVLEGVVLTAGPRPETGAGRLGASIDFRLRDGSRDRFASRVSVSGTTASLLAEGPLGGQHHGSWIVSVRRSYLDWLLRQIDPQSNDTFGFVDGVARLSWDVTPRQHLTFTLLGGHSTLHEASSEPNSLDHATTGTTAASVEWRVSVNPSLMLTERAYAVVGQYRNQVPDAASREHGWDHDVLYRSRVLWTPRAGATLEAGGQAERRSAERGERGTAGAVGTPVVSYHGTQTSAAAWASLQLTPAPRLSLDLGSRVERWQASPATRASPWLLADLTVTPATHLRAGASLAHQGPSSDDLALAPAGTLAPEAAALADVGIERRFGASWRASATAYWRREHDGLRIVGEPRVEDEIVRGRPVSVANALAGRASGLELFLQRRAVTGLSGWVGYSFGRAQSTDASRGETFDADNEPRHALTAYVSYRTSPRTSVSARWRSGSNLPLAGYFDQVGDTYYLGTRPNGVRLPAYGRLDLRADHAFTFERHRLTLFVEVLNGLNRANYGPADPTYNARTGQVTNLIEKLFPILPSIGFTLEF